MVARAPTGVPDRTDVPRQRFAPDGAQNAPGATRSPQRARSRADASQKPAPRAPTAGAYGGARTDRHTSPHRRYAPALRARRRPERARSQPEARNAPGASQKPVPRARRPLARVVARAPTGIPARTDVTRRRFAPDAAQNAPGASQKPGTRQEPARSPYRARAVRWRVSWRAHRPAYQPATALRASASRQTPAASAYRTLLRFSTITDPVRIRLRRPGIA